MRVYHFVNDSYGKQNLEKKRLKVARIMELNDPFEFLGMDLTDRVARYAINKTKEDLNKGYGILCFSKNWKNPVQWAHYADKHKGICLGFDIPDHLLNKVEYINERISYSGGEFTLKEIMIFFTSKFKHWEYENEYRCFSELINKDGDLYFSKFSSTLILKEVIVGASSNLNITDIASLVDEEVEIFKVRPAFKTFQMVQNKTIKKIRGKITVSE
ncbi:DUF2971 domain-containing protein [Marinomonas posidonica]|uniref:DUF2971 domain-containing protein n=1 Tax=Marinomonas posidonica TaxID=936476 RepID=UPI003736FCE9